jgi:hypothetical protein
MILALVMPFAVLGIANMDDKPAMRALVGIPVLLGGVLSVVTWRGVASDTTSHIEHAHRATARWVATHVALGEPVAAFDIGAIGFELGDRRVVDLGGLVDPKYLPYLREGQACRYLADRRVRFLVIPEEINVPDRVVDLATRIGAFCPGQTSKQIARFATPHRIWQNAWDFTGNAYPELAVYEVGSLQQGTEVAKVAIDSR